MKRLLSVLVYLCAGCLLAGCGSSSARTALNTSPPPAPLAITSGTPFAATVAYAGSSSGFSLTASGGKSPYTWSWAAASGSSLPPGLSISTNADGTGTIAGTPSTAGSYSLVVAVTDSGSPRALAVANYTIAVAPSGSLTIASGLPPSGTVGESYGGAHSVTEQHATFSFTGWPLTATGGVSGYHWSWSAAQGSSLPPGLNVTVLTLESGGSTRCCVTAYVPVIGGTPTAAGTYHVIVTATDSRSPAAQASANYTIVISGASAAAAELKAAPSPRQYHHYKLTDLGTLSGPQSYVNFPNNYAPVLNDQSTATGWADTSELDPNPNFCFNQDCFVSHAFQARNGVLPPADLGVLPGGSSSQANWISANGLIAGLSQNGETDQLFPGFPEVRAVLWTNGQIADLGTLPEGGYESFASAVNSRGQVVGLATNMIPDDFSLFGTAQARAFLWQDGRMQDLGTLGGADSMALLVNEQGQIVGESYTGSSLSAYCANIGFPLTTGAFLWENGKMTDLGSFGGSCTFASDLNNQGQVIGLSTLPGDTAQHPFLWDHGVLTDLGTLGGNNGFGDALNDAGDVVGWTSLRGDQALHAFLWKNGTMIDLGTVGGDACSFGFTINSAEQVVGISVPGCDFSQARASFWEGGGPMVDLNELIPPNATLHLTLSETINDRGEIVGNGVDPEGNQHAFLLIPCDENHPNIEGCDYSLIAVAASDQPEPPQNAQLSSPTTAAKLTPSEVMTRFRSLVAGRNRRYGMPQTFSTASAITNIEPAPTNLTSFAFKRGLYDVVELLWTDHSTDADSYHIERCNGSTCTNFSEIAVTGGSATRYIDFMWPMHLTFRYRVRAHSPSGFSAYSNIRTQTTP
jgi:probable HAF family extracellular repeat protein